ncbi:MAG TPA: transglycosylase domain-containing protein [Actinomycetota bacterium]|nr:transglycosylase domain-containing protein [Actinomycetota bacterium]
MRRIRGPVAWFGVLAVIAASCSVPDLDDFGERPLAQTTFLYAADGTLITELHAVEDRVVLARGEMPEALRDAVVAIEDRRFFSHHGIDPEAIVRAAIVNTDEGRIVEGGSTITQQLVKLLYVGDETTLRRKWDEALLAWQLEDRFTKDQILTRYLNTVYFGQGAYGAQAAARTYFGVDAEDLTVAQSATLAGLISAPNHFDPFVRPRAAIGRRNVILRLMRQTGAIGASTFRAARRERLVLRLDRPALTRHPYPYFVDYFKRWFLGNPDFGETRADRYQLLFTGGLRITTTIDPAIQRAAEESIRSVLAYPTDPDAAMTILDPRTGSVKALVGGKDRDYWLDVRAGRVNLATGAGGTGRQTGSAFKPFALVAALEDGMSAETVFPAPASLALALDDGSVWNVTNADGSGYGSMTLRSATVNSVNTVYAQLIARLGADTVNEVATRMGMRCCGRVARPRGDLDPYLSSVLGANEANTLEMAAAYGTLATGGRLAHPLPVTRITDARGDVVWEADPKPKQVVEPQVAAEAVDILNDVVTFGTGAAATIGRPQIGKTGTDEDHANAWFVGAVPQLAAAVWVGYLEGEVPMEPPRTRNTVFGGTWPAQIWRLTMLRATAGLSVMGFPTPSIDHLAVAVDVTQDPYCLPNRYTLPQNIETLRFIEGTEPLEECAEPDSLERVIVPSTVGFLQLDAMSQLRDAGFYVEVELVESTQPAGTVVYQKPAGGTSEEQTSTVRLSVAQAPDG